MKCPECQSELVKAKGGFLCLECGYASKSGTKSSATKAAAKTTSVKVKVAASKPATLRASSGQASSGSKVAAQSAPKPKPKAKGVKPAKPAAGTKSADKLATKVVAKPAVPVVPIAMDAKANNSEGHSTLQASSGQASSGNNNAPQTSALPKDDHQKIMDHVHEQLHAADHTAPIHAKKPKMPGQPKPVRTWTLVVVIIVVIAALVAAYILPAQAAAKRFQAKFTGLQSVRASGDMKLEASAFLSVINSDVKFDGVYADQGKANGLTYTGKFLNRDYAGSFLASNGKLYSQMTGQDLPFIRYNQGIATYQILPSQWYSSKIDNDLYKYYCETRPDTEYQSGLTWYQALRQIKLQPSPLVGYNVKIDGHATTHLRGTIDRASLAAAWDNINSSLPDGCQIQLLVEPGNLDIDFDLYTSKDYDQIRLHIADKTLGLTGSIKLVLDQYNQAAAPVTPTGTISLSDVFAARAAIQARDYQRRADIDNLKKALDAYAAANRNSPPSSLARLSSRYIATVPKDPNGSNYSYTVRSRQYTLTATLEDAGQQYVVTGP